MHLVSVPMLLYPSLVSCKAVIYEITPTDPYIISERECVCLVNTISGNKMIFNNYVRMLFLHII